MRNFILALVAMFMVTTTGHAQQFFSPVRVTRVAQYHTTVGTTTAAAIPSANVTGNLVSWKVCNDAVNTSTYLLVGQATDASTDGTSLAPGACFECANCTTSLLKLMKVKGQAASNGYSVLQYNAP